MKGKFSFTLIFLLCSLLNTSLVCSQPRTPTGLCINNHCNKIDHETKWNPGHYINAGHRKTTFPDIIHQPHFKGAKITYNWADLETDKGVYDFSLIEQALTELRQYDKRLVIMLKYKTFNKWAKRGACAPRYVHDMGGVELKFPEKGTKKCIAANWRQPVLDRINALVDALGERFNDESHFEAIIFPETSVGIKPEPKDYNAASYNGALKAAMTAAKQAFPNTQVIQFANWTKGPQSEMDALMEHAYTVGAGFGGPDLMPHNPSHATKNFPRYAGRMSLMIDNQWGGEIMKHIKKGGTPEDAYYYAVDNPNGLHTNYIFWANSGDETWDFETMIVPMINKKKGRTNSACPENISPCVSSNQ